MKISSIQNLNCEHNNIGQTGKNQSFGHIVPKRSYMRKVKRRNDSTLKLQKWELKNFSPEDIKILTEKTNFDLDAIKKLTKETIDLKKILEYRLLKTNEKLIMDEFLAVMPKEEIDDLTVKLNVVDSRRGSYSMTCIGDTVGRYHDEIHMIVKLPVYDEQKGKIKYKKVDIGDTIRTSDYIKDFIKLSVKIDHEEKLKALGFKYGWGSANFSNDAMPVPADNILDVIGDKIRKHFDDMICQKMNP